MVFTDYVHKMRSSPHSTTVLSVLPHGIKGRRTPSATLKQMPRFMKLGLVVIVCALCISLFSQSVAPSFLKQGEATSPFPASGQGFTYKERFRGLILGAPTGPGTPDYLEYDRIITGYVESVAGTTITYRENWQIENIIPRIQYFHNPTWWHDDLRFIEFFYTPGNIPSREIQAGTFSYVKEGGQWQAYWPEGSWITQPYIGVWPLYTEVNSETRSVERSWTNWSRDIAMVTVAWGFFKDDEIHVYGDPGIPCVKTTGDDFDLAVAPEQAIGSTITIEGDTLTLVGYEHLITPATTQWCMRFEETDQTGLHATRWYDEDTGVLLKTLWQGDHEVWLWNMETNQGAWSTTTFPLFIEMELTATDAGLGDDGPPRIFNIQLDPYSTYPGATIDVTAAVLDQSGVDTVTAQFFTFKGGTWQQDATCDTVLTDPDGDGNYTGTLSAGLLEGIPGGDTREYRVYVHASDTQSNEFTAGYQTLRVLTVKTELKDTLPIETVHNPQETDKGCYAALAEHFISLYGPEPVSQSTFSNEVFGEGFGRVYRHYTGLPLDAEKGEYEKGLEKYTGLTLTSYDTLTWDQIKASIDRGYAVPAFADQSLFAMGNEGTGHATLIVGYEVTNDGTRKFIFTDVGRDTEDLNWYQEASEDKLSKIHVAWIVEESS